MSFRVLVSNLMMLHEFAHFQAVLAEKQIEAVRADVRQFLSEAELLPIIGEYDGMLAGDDQLSEAVLNAGLPRLKVISKWGTGIDSIDLDAARRLGIQVYNTPGAFRDAVSEVALGYMLMLTRYLHQVDQAVREGLWPKPTGSGLVDLTIGLIGYGAIGQGVAERVAGFKPARILAYDPGIARLADGDVAELAEFDKVVTEADILCVCCNYSADNHHLIDQQVLSQMKNSAILINVARGPLVDERALVEALQAGTLGGAGLDVFETEPLPKDHPLITMDNVILGSHNANNTTHANAYVHANTLKNLYRGLGIS